MCAPQPAWFGSPGEGLAQHRRATSARSRLTHAGENLAAVREQAVRERQIQATGLAPAFSVHGRLDPSQEGTHSKVLPRLTQIKS